ncbi:hypothetical protein Pelo_1202 [Pelomyxa schiedti]|nr:hypothetical protein Pelo_1202 [Pelomyxa schiedti]
MRILGISVDQTDHPMGLLEYFDCATELWAIQERFYIICDTLESASILEKNKDLSWGNHSISVVKPQAEWVEEKGRAPEVSSVLSAPYCRRIFGMHKSIKKPEIAKQYGRNGIQLKSDTDIHKVNKHRYICFTNEDQATAASSIMWNDVVPEFAVPPEAEFKGAGGPNIYYKYEKAKAPRTKEPRVVKVQNEIHPTEKKLHWQDDQQLVDALGKTNAQKQQAFEEAQASVKSLQEEYKKTAESVVKWAQDMRGGAQNQNPSVISGGDKFKNNNNGCSSPPRSLSLQVARHEVHDFEEKKLRVLAELKTKIAEVAACKNKLLEALGSGKESAAAADADALTVSVAAEEQQLVDALGKESVQKEQQLYAAQLEVNTLKEG